MNLTDRQIDMLRGMVGIDTFVAPMMLGGTDGSWHSQTLSQLVKKGLVDRIGGPSPWGGRGCYHYKINEAGEQALEQTLTKDTPND